MNYTKSETAAHAAGYNDPHEKHLEEMSQSLRKPWYKQAVGWFSLIAMLASILAVVISIVSIVT